VLLKKEADKIDFAFTRRPYRT